jgi:uridine phosphorylase
MSDEREYHIGIASGEIPPLVLLPGDPDRARLIAEQFFDNPVEIAKKREYWSFKGEYRGVPVAVCSTGIGCPSAAIAIEELIKVGCTGAVRDDGTSKQYVPVEYPALADPALFIALEKAARDRGAKHRVGVGHSKDAFYSEHPGLVADPARMKARWDTLRRINVLATEMEAAALFVIGQLRGVSVGAACVIIGEPIENETKIVGKPPLDDLVTIALDAITSSSNK